MWRLLAPPNLPAEAYSSDSCPPRTWALARCARTSGSTCEAPWHFQFEHQRISGVVVGNLTLAHPATALARTKNHAWLRRKRNLTQHAQVSTAKPSLWRSRLKPDETNSQQKACLVGSRKPSTNFCTRLGFLSVKQKTTLIEANGFACFGRFCKQDVSCGHRYDVSDFESL